MRGRVFVVVRTCDKGGKGLILGIEMAGLRDDDGGGTLTSPQIPRDLDGICLLPPPHRVDRAWFPGLAPYLIFLAYIRFDEMFLRSACRPPFSIGDVKASVPIGW